MRTPVDISLRGVPASGALERLVGEQARQLERHCERVRACHVTIEALHREQQPGAKFAVRLNIMLPGTEVVVNREHGEDVYMAVREAFEAAGLQLSDHMRRQGNSERGPSGAIPRGKQQP
jgi:ribosome-associated translation inhibitor RaiA